MSEGQIDGRACDTDCYEGGITASLGAADWLSLAAAPAFALMALLTAAHGGGPADMHSSATQVASPLSGMALMYLLMSVFHSAPWLKLIASRRSAPSGPGRNLT